MRLHCNDWKALREALGEGQTPAFEASRSDLHVWSRDEPSAGDRCQCGARRWAPAGPSPRAAHGGASGGARP